MVFAGRVPTDSELQAHYRDYGHSWQDSPITRKRYAELLDGFETARKTARILDFGCGAGYFLEAARARGWEAYGTEYSGHALELAREKGLNVVEAPLGGDAFAPGFFDVITAFEVFEHVRDPRTEASTVSHLVRPGGLLYCTTPNFNALSRRLLGARWGVISYPEHLCYFTPRTLRYWLRGHGFTAESIRSTGISPACLREAISSSPSTTPPAAADQRLREVTEASSALRLSKQGINGVLSLLAIGDTLKGRFRRSDAPDGM
jgi:2-polyprenyl-3-methyl-5-hydroxy-6-metoxy-1,4-benzoquinol methylase